MTEQAPVAWQNVAGTDGKRTAVSVRYTVTPQGSIGFRLGNYDSTRPLTIDPMLAYSTYLGGSGDDHGNGIAVDSAGNAYITGYTNSTNFPLASSYQPSNAGGADVFVTKLNADGSGLIYSTYLGGTGNDYGWSIAVGGSNNVYVSGTTESLDFPTHNAYQPSNRGASNAFVTRIAANGASLIYSTYLGSTGNDPCSESGTDIGYGLAVDASGNAYIAGYSLGYDFPQTVGFPNGNSEGNCGTAFAAKLNTNASGSPSLVYSGSFAGPTAQANAVAIDRVGNAYIVGSFERYFNHDIAFPIKNAIQPSYAGNGDGFLTVLNSAGTDFVYSTFLGGSGIDSANGVALDTVGNAYVTGSTSSTDFPTHNPYQANNGGGQSDAFITQLNADGSAYIYSTYFGGADEDVGYSIAVDGSSNAYFTGLTYSTNFPTQDPIQPINHGGGDAFAGMLNASGSTLGYSTYLGGTNADYSASVTASASGDAYLTGTTSSTDFPTRNAYQSTQAGSADAFVTKLSKNTPQANEMRCGGSPSQIQTTNSVGDLVNTGTGYYCYADSYLSVPGRGVPLQFSVAYNSDMTTQYGPIGYGWTHNYNMYIDRDQYNNYLVHEENGSVSTFASDFSHPLRVMATLTATTGTNPVFTFTRNHGQERFYFKTLSLLSTAKIYKLYQITDRNGYNTLLNYSAGGVLQSVSDTEGRTLTFSYNAGLLTNVHDDTGARNVSFSYPNNTHMTITDVGGKQTSLLLSSDHMLQAVTDPNGGVTTNVYDKSYRVAKQTDPEGRYLSFGYSLPAGVSTRVTDTLGLVTLYEYTNNKIQRVTEHVGLQPAVWNYAYQPGTTWVSSVSDPLTHVWSATWDNSGNKLTSTDPLSRTIQYAYNTANDPTVITNSIHLTTTYAYDSVASGNLLSVSRPVTETGETASIHYTYDPAPGRAGDVITITNELGKQWGQRYNSYGYLTSSSDPLTNSTLYNYDTVGRLRSTTDPNGHPSYSVPNAYGDPLTTTNTLGFDTIYSYDNNRNLKTVQDPKRQVTTYYYDYDNQLTRTVMPDSSYSATTYDGLGRVYTQTNPLRQQTTYTYDDANWRYNVHDPLERSQEYAFDLAGNLWRKQDAQGIYTYFSYYPDNLLHTIDYGDPSTPDVSYSYNSRGLRASMSDGTGSTTYGYDSLDRLASVTDGSGHVVRYHYDLASNVQQVNYPPVLNGDAYDPRSVYYTHNDANRISQITYLTSGFAVGLDYDPNGNLTTETYPWTAFTQKKTAYDSANQVISTTTYVAGETSPIDIQYSRDPLGQVYTSTERVVNGGGRVAHQYAYDKQNRLTGDLLTNATAGTTLSTTYHYDAASQLTQTLSIPLSGPGAGETLTSTRQYDSAGELYSLQEYTQTRTLKDLTLTYDPRGNRRTLNDAVGGIGGGGQVFTYTFNMADQLVSYYNNAYQAEYKYNGDGLRTSKIDPTYDIGVARPISYTWDILGVGAGGLPLMLQEQEPQGVGFDNGYYTNSYMYSVGGEVVTREVVNTPHRPNGAGNFPGALLGNPEAGGVGGVGQSKPHPNAPVENGLIYLGDAQGSIRLFRNDLGQVQASYSYDAYGRRTCTMPGGPSECEASTPFGYTGQYTDNESGLLYERARYYDPQTQQFISRDPAVERTGQPYGYAYGNPVNYTDPSGLEGMDPIEQPNGTWVQPSLPGFGELLRSVGQGLNGGEGGLPEGPTPIRGRPVGTTRPDYDRTNGRGIYVGIDGEGTVRYVGQGDAPSRVRNHMLEPEHDDLSWEIVANNNLTKSEARGLEQLLIDHYGGRGGGQLRNDNNGAGARNRNLQAYLNAGRPLLREALDIIQNGR
ncbi:MAG: SBBP repeat-containing protein [Chloroflexi bacterium]|nr:SBBP repeat-containing protein [Chloroflexota bacterium]